ncbi:MAG: heavy-metal-associated domain-containing protein [Gemmatimonadaceae bacterium]|nr:heavy-metal-associated domain-containing protein [Gemmatimonadaceae bacterium]
MEQVALNVKGMSCEHCVRAVEAALIDVAGVGDTDVTIGSATVTFDPKRASVSDLIDAVSDAGYVAEEMA